MKHVKETEATVRVWARVRPVVAAALASRAARERRTLSQTTALAIERGMGMVPEAAKPKAKERQR